MEYGKIISISGMTGLYELVGSKKDGAIVKSLLDKSTKFVSSRIHNFSHLESIEVYTTGENVNLVDVLQAIQQSGETLPSEKSPAEIKSFFQKVYPEIDFERVYASDMKKMIKWYVALHENDVELKLSEEDDEIETGVNDPETSVVSPDAAEEIEPQAKPAEAKPAEIEETTQVTEDNAPETNEPPVTKTPLEAK